MSKVLIVSGGSVDTKLLSETIDNFDKVIAVDKGLESIYDLGKVPDLIVGDFDSVNSKVIEFYKNQDTKIYEYDSEKDYTDTELALNIAIDLKPNSITIIGGIGTRIDHTLANIHIMKKCLENDINCEIVDRNNRVCLVDGYKEIKKNEAFGKYISIISLTTKSEGITLQGFKYPLEEYTLEIGKSLGISNEILEETATIEVKNGILILIESKD